MLPPSNARRRAVVAVRAAVTPLTLVALASPVLANSGTQIPLSQFNPGAQQTNSTIVTNGNFETVSPVDPGNPTNQDAVGWIREANTIYPNTPFNPPPNPALTGSYAAQGLRYNDASDKPVYTQFINRSNFEAGKDYVLSAFMWNRGNPGFDPSTNGSDNVQVKIEDTGSGGTFRNITLFLEANAKDGASAANGYFVYMAFNEAQLRYGDQKSGGDRAAWTGSVLNLLAYGDLRNPGAGGEPNPYFQVDNVSITPVGEWAKYTWNAAGGGTWSTAGNWSTNRSDPVPSAAMATALFGPAATANANVTLDQPRTVGTIVFDNATRKYTLSGAAITIAGADAREKGTNGSDSRTAHGEIRVAAGSHEIASNLVLETRADINVAAGAALKLSGKVTGQAYGISLGAGATLDITNNTIPLTTWNGSMGPDPGATLRGMILAAYNKGKWNQPGLTSSTAASDARGATGLGYANIFEVGSQIFGDHDNNSNTPNQLVGYRFTTNGTQYTYIVMYDGFNNIVTREGAVVRYTWYGDANLDGLVNSADFARISDTGTTWVTGDFNYDGKVSPDDYALFALGAAASNGQPATTEVPEPAVALGASAFCLAPLLRRRRTA